MCRDAFILDFVLLDEHGLSVEEFIALINITRNILNSREILVSLQSKQFVKLIDESIVMREKGNILLRLVTIGDETPKAKKKVTPVSEEFTAFIEEYRVLWRGLKSGSMGSLSSCREKMLIWMEENPLYTTDQIIRSAKMYLDSLNGDYRYLQRADFFISKVENGINNSRLSAFIDEVDDKPVSDWTTSLS